MAPLSPTLWKISFNKTKYRINLDNYCYHFFERPLE